MPTPRFVIARGLAAFAVSMILAASPVRGQSATEKPVEGVGDDTDGWNVLSDSLGSENWRGKTGAWYIAGDAKLNPENERLLVGEPGEGVIVNGPGRTTNITTKAEFGDVAFHCEFMVPRGSNAGVKFESVYEIQIYDSYGVETPKASDCGGIYPRAELLPRYHHIDEGFPPLSNASRPPGTWQTLDIVFRAPKFDESGKKVENARMEKVELNGQLVQDNVEMATPTGNNWTRKEEPQGPILLQADHGPVAFRDVRVRRLVEQKSK